jgi:hypothetical protein
MKKAATSAVAMFALLASTSAFAQGTHGPSQFGTSNNNGVPPNIPNTAPNWNVNAFDPSTGGGMQNDAATDVTSVTATFILTGSVAQNCSYFSGSSSTQTIGLGAIGIKNGNNQNIGQLFNQIDPIDVEITSTNAGCNTDNTVTVTKGANGLFNPTKSGYDTNQFTNSIPYSVKVGITDATLQGQVGQGTFQTFTVPTTSTTGSGQFGAWRSSLDLMAQIPAQPLGLVAGAYSDTITVTLAASVSS